jgi:hypothetical protein
VSNKGLLFCRHTCAYAAMTKDAAQLEHPDFLRSRQVFLEVALPVW